MTVTTEIAPNALKDRLTAWLKERDLAPETVHWYTPAEWIARGEDLGNDALLSAVIEQSPLYRILNHCTSDDVATVDALNTFLEGLGCYYDLGFCWSLHFYPV